MKITVRKDPALPGVYRASMGKRKVLISLSAYDAHFDVKPSAWDVRTAFNDTSTLRDDIIGDNVPVLFVERRSK